MRTIGEGSIRLRADIDVDLTGLERWGQEVVQRSMDFRPWFEEVYVPTFIEIEKRVYESEGAFSGHAADWSVPYSDRYAEWKEMRVGHLRKGHLEEKLFEGLTGQGGDSFVVMDPFDCIIGSDPESSRTGYHYADVQQRGTMDGRVPPRPPLALWDEWPEHTRSQLGDSVIFYILFGEMMEVEV